MTNRVSHARQYPLFIEQVIDYTDLITANLVGGVSAVQLELPQGAIVVGGGIFVETVFNGTTPTLDIGITGDDNLYVNDLDLATLGYTAFSTGQGLKASGETILLTPDAGVAAATAGAARIVVQYLQAGRAHEAQA